MFWDVPAATACVIPDPPPQTENEQELRANTPLVVQTPSML